MECGSTRKNLCQGLILKVNDMKIIVISDIHGNASALKTALEDVELLAPDVTVILGDLLTYGCEPLEVLSILKKYEESNSCVFVKGNHDQFYFDLESDKKEFDYVIPDFVLESIYWTLNKLNGVNIQSMFDWKDSFSIEDIYFAHANPFEYGDWRYVESPENIFEASVKLNKNSFKVGVFGHSHRASAVRIHLGNDISKVSEGIVILDNSSTYIFNPGSVGQPRGEGLSFMLLTLNKNKLGVKFYSVNVENKYSEFLIHNSNMSTLTKEKLISYFGVNH